MNNDYLRGVIDATIELNKLAGIESTTVSFGSSTNRLTAIWESEVKVIASAGYYIPQETETIFTTEHLKIVPETPVLTIVNFITDCTEQAMKDEYNNL
jgi:hypothetical protein